MSKTDIWVMKLPPQLPEQIPILVSMMATHRQWNLPLSVRSSLQKMSEIVAAG